MCDASFEFCNKQGWIVLFFNISRDVFEERITSYRKLFLSHQEYYYQNPLAQKLLELRAENQEIECRLKVYDEQFTIKQKELDHLTGDKPFIALLTLTELNFYRSIYSLFFCVTRPSSQPVFHWETTREVFYIDCYIINTNGLRRGYLYLSPFTCVCFLVFLTSSS